MTNKISTDSTQLLSGILDNLLQTKEMQQKLNAKVEKALTDIVEDSLRWNSPAKKLLEEKINTAMTVAVKNITLPEWSAYLEKEVKKVVTDHYQTSAQTVLLQSLGECLKPAPKEITVQGLLDFFLEPLREEVSEDPCSCQDRGNPEVEIVIKDSLADSPWYEILIWLEGQKVKTYSWESGSTKTKSPSVVITIWKGKLISNPLKKVDYTHQNGLREIFKCYASGTIVTDIDEQYQCGGDFDLNIFPDDY